MKNEFIWKVTTDGWVSVPVTFVMLLGGRTVRYIRAQFEISDGRVKKRWQTHEKGRFFVIPSLCDCHVHGTMHGEISLARAEDLVENHPDQAAEAMLAYYADMVGHGITIIGDKGPVGSITARTFKLVFEAIKRGELAPYVRAALHTIGAKDEDTFAYGHLRTISTSEDVKAVFKEAEMFGPEVNIVKIIAESGLKVEEKNGEIGIFGYNQTIKDELLYLICKLAQKKFLVAVHAKGMNSIASACRLGVNAIEHAIEALPSDLKELQKKNIFVIPTLQGLWCRLKHAEEVISRATTPNEIRAAKLLLVETKYEWQRCVSLVEMLNKLNDGDPATNWCAGSDSGSKNTPHPALPGELQRAKELGVDPAYILWTSAVAGRGLLGFGGKGLLTSGDPAHFIFLEKDPLKIYNFEKIKDHIAAVVIDGRIVAEGKIIHQN